MEKRFLLCLVFLPGTSSQSAVVPSTAAPLTGPPNCVRFTDGWLCLSACNARLAAATATWVTGGSGFVNCPPLFLQLIPGDARLQCPGAAEAGYSMAELLGSHTAVACWQRAQSRTTRKADMLTTACSKENESFCLCSVGLDGRGKEGASGRVPSWAVHESVGRFKGRHLANSEAVGQIPPSLFSA